MRGSILLLVVLASGCAASGARPAPFPSAPSGATTADAAGIVRGALALRGAPYRNGGADPSGFDCSGLVAFVFAREGISLPRTVAEQYRAGRPVSARDLRPGDLVFFRISGRAPSHVGIVVSGGEFLHAPTSAGLVRVESLASRYWATRFAGGRRIG